MAAAARRRGRKACPKVGTAGSWKRAMGTERVGATTETTMAADPHGFGAGLSAGARAQQSCAFGRKNRQQVPMLEQARRAAMVAAPRIRVARPTTHRTPAGAGCQPERTPS